MFHSKLSTDGNLENLKAIDNPYGFRDFDWDDFRYVLDVSTEYHYDLIQYRRSLMKKRRGENIKLKQKSE